MATGISPVDLLDERLPAGFVELMAEELQKMSNPKG